MRPYRVQSSSLEKTAHEPSAKRRRLRAIAIVVATVGAHVAVLGAAFAMRAPEPTKPRTEVVRVLAGHVDPTTGDFAADGVADARIAKK